MPDAPILDGLWRFEALHPEWSEDDGEAEGWEQLVAWWALATPGGVLLIDPLVDDWDATDRLVAGHGGCAGVVRMLHWHERSVAAAAERYKAPVWALAPGPGVPELPRDRPLADGGEVTSGVRAFVVERHDEVALWLPRQAALLFADAMLRRPSGELRVCPESWTQPDGGPARLRAVLARLAELPVEHVLVSHGPLVLGGGSAALAAALAD